MLLADTPGTVRHVTDGHRRSPNARACITGRSTCCSCAPSTGLSRPSNSRPGWPTGSLPRARGRAASTPGSTGARAPRADLGARRQRDHRQPVDPPGRCAAAAGRRRADDDAADDHQPAVPQSVRHGRRCDGGGPRAASAALHPAEDQVRRRGQASPASRCPTTPTTTRSTEPAPGPPPPKSPGTRRGTVSPRRSPSSARLPSWPLSVAITSGPTRVSVTMRGSRPAGAAPRAFRVEDRRDDVRACRRSRRRAVRPVPVCAAGARSVPA